MSAMVFTYSKKQAGVVYKAWKSGKVAASKDAINRMYAIAENGFAANMDTLHKRVANDAVRMAVEAICQGRCQKA